MPFTEGSRLYAMRSQNMFKYLTDDRGEYRIYGIWPGRYKVSFGVAPDEISGQPSAGGRYARTFHPDVADDAKSPVIEVIAGAEVTGIDITAGRLARTFV